MTSIILLITAQLASAYDGPATVLIDMKRMKQAALITGLLFLVTVAINIYQLITTT